MAYKLMFIPKNDTQTYPFCGLKLVVETFERSINQPIDIYYSRQSGLATKKKTLL